MLLVTALFRLLQDVPNRRLLFKTNRQQQYQRNHHPSFLRFWNWAEENGLMQPKFVAAQKMLLNRNPANIRKWIARFYYFRHLPAEARVYCSILYELPIDSELYLHCSLIYSGSFQLFLHSDQPLSEGQPVQRCLPVGGGCIIHAGGGGGFTHWLTDCFDATDDDQRQHHHAEHQLQL